MKQCYEKFFQGVGKFSVIKMKFPCTNFDGFWYMTYYTRTILRLSLKLEFSANFILVEKKKILEPISGTDYSTPMYCTCGRFAENLFQLCDFEILQLGHGPYERRV